MQFHGWNHMVPSIESHVALHPVVFFIEVADIIVEDLDASLESEYVCTLLEHSNVWAVLRNLPGI